MRNSAVSTSGGSRASALSSQPDDRQLRGEARAFLGRAHVLPQRGDQAQVVQHRRPQLERQLAHLVQRLGRQVAQVRDQLAGLDGQVGRVGLGHAGQAALQADDHRRQRLAGLVVQLARDAPALLLLGHDDLRGQPLGLLGLLANGGRVGFQPIPQRVDVEDERGHVGVGERRQTRARRVVAGVEALGRLAQRVDGAEVSRSSSIVKPADRHSAASTSTAWVERREAAVQDQALGEPRADRARRQARRQVHAEQPPEQRHAQPARVRLGDVGRRVRWRGARPAKTARCSPAKLHGARRLRRVRARGDASTPAAAAPLPTSAAARPGTAGRPRPAGPRAATTSAPAACRAARSASADSCLQTLHELQASHETQPFGLDFGRPRSASMLRVEAADPGLMKMAPLPSETARARAVRDWSAARRCVQQDTPVPPQLLAHGDSASAVGCSSRSCAATWVARSRPGARTHDATAGAARLPPAPRPSATGRPTAPLEAIEAQVRHAFAAPVPRPPGRRVRAGPSRGAARGQRPRDDAARRSRGSACSTAPTPDGRPRTSGRGTSPVSATATSATATRCSPTAAHGARPGRSLAIDRSAISSCATAATSPLPSGHSSDSARGRGI